MNLTELFNKLALGELSNLALAEGGVIAEGNKESIVLHANAGLELLYSRFLLKDGALVIHQQTNDRTSYPLDSDYAQSNTNPANTKPRYIIDLAEPFTDDVVKILAVYDEFGNKLPLNEPDNPASLFTPQPTILQVPHPSEGKPLSVMYQAAHPKVRLTTPSTELELPRFLHGALTAFIAHKVFGFMNTQESNAKSRDHLNTYESICVAAIEQDLISAGWNTGTTRFIRNGWV